jgi:hypothetical protein
MLKILHDINNVEVFYTKSVRNGKPAEVKERSILHTVMLKITTQNGSVVSI